MNHLTRHDYASALQLLACIEAQADDVEDFARVVVFALHGYVAAELTVLSVCDLVTGDLRMVGRPGMYLGTFEIARLDPHFVEPPQLRRHDFDGSRVARRDFQRSALYGDDGHRMGTDYTIAVPLFRNPQTLVSVVLNRRGRDFDERDRERLDLLRPHLAFLYRHARKLRTALPGAEPLAPGAEASPTGHCRTNGLTLREDQVMHWLACGKTDAEIAALLSISTRTVQKHLQHVYVKLGVETRTAAVMRAHAGRNQG